MSTAGDKGGLASASPPDVLPFRRRPRTREEQLRAAVLAECLDITLTKGDRSRRYWIRPGKIEGQWYCQVWFGQNNQHRGETTSDWQRVHRLQAEYFREVADLELDGWSATIAVDPRQVVGDSHPP